MNTCTISRRRPFQLIVGFPKLQCEGLPRLEISLRELHQFIQPLALVVAAYGLVQRDHHTSSTGLLSGDHEGKGCRSTRPFESSTYFFTRLLTWLPSLSTARCNSLWQRYVFLSLSSSLMNSSLSLRSPDTQCKRPVSKFNAPEIHILRLVPGVRRCFCLPFRIQQKPTLGLVSSLVSSWKNDPASSVIRRTSSSLARFSSTCSSELFSGGTGRGGLLQRKPRRWSARRTVSRLTAEAARSLRSCRASSLQLQRERNQPCQVGESSSSRRSKRSFASLPSKGLGPRLRRSSKAALCPPGGSGIRARTRWCASRTGRGRSRWESGRRRRAARCAS